MPVEDAAAAVLFGLVVGLWLAAVLFEVVYWPTVDEDG